MACNFVDLPPVITPLLGKRLLKVEIRASGAGGEPETIYTYVIPHSVALLGMAAAHDAIGQIEGQESANVLAFQKAAG